MSWTIPIIILLDQLTKYWSESVLKLNPISLGIFKLTYAENTGIAFGMLSEKAYFHGIFSTFIAAILLIFRDKLRSKSKILDLSLCFIIGGAIGNIIDRIRFGYVVDMFYVPYFSIFNIADSFVTIGGFLLVIYLIWGNKNDRKNFSR